MAKSKPEYDLILWGATGFTGALVARHLVTHYGVDGELRWALAGRDRSKLERLRAELVGADDLEALPLVIADSESPDSLAAMVEATRVICSTVGPYARYGSGLVAACAAAGTDYCDLTGEVPWMVDMIATYQSEAERSGARLVHTCGFDSIPSDLGVWFLQQQMMAHHGAYAQQVKGRVGRVSGGASGGTVASMLGMVEQATADRAVREALTDPYSLYPVTEPPGRDRPDRMLAQYDQDFEQWTAPFVMAAINTRVVRRSNALQGFPYGREFRYDEAMLTGTGVGGRVKANAISGASLAGGLALAVKPARKLAAALLPSPGDGPTPAQQESGHFELFFHGLSPAESASLLVRVSGDRDPGYGATSRMLGESAVCLATDQLPADGGFFTPAAAMAAPLLARLERSAGMSFEVIESA